MKKVMIFMMLLVMTTALCACNGGTDEQNEGPDSVYYGGKITVGITQDLDSLDPHKAVAAGTKEVLYNIFEGLIKVSKDGEFVYFNYEGGLGIYSVNKNKLVKKITLPQRIINLQENDDFIFLLTLGNNTYTVYLLEKSFVMQGHFSFQAESAFIKTMDNILYVGKDNTISKLNIKRE